MQKITELLRLTTGQRRAVTDRARFHVIAGGEMSGKTALGIDSLIESITAGSRSIWIGANAQELQRARARLRDMLDDWIVKTTPAQIVFGNGAICDFYDWQNMPKTAPEAAALIVDDLHLMPGFGDYWQTQGRDLIRLNNGGEALFLGCANGQQSDFFRLYQKGNEDFAWSCATLPTTANEQYLTPELLAAIKQTPEAERAQRFYGVFHKHAILLTADHRVLRPGERFIDWCERLAADGLLVDGKPFKLDNRPAMRFLYEQIPATLEEGRKKRIIFLKATQLGFSVFEMLASLYVGLRFPGIGISLFVPTQTLSNDKSKQRFIPMCRSVPAVAQLMARSEDGEGNIRSRRIGATLYKFGYAAGKVSTESTPADVLFLDETQELTNEQIAKIAERTSASNFAMMVSGSTANMPESDIHGQFLQGTQHEFYTRCPGCGNMEPMIRAFPNIVVKQPQGGYRYECQQCHAEITDPQDGEWRARFPERAQGSHPCVSIHFPQFLSPTVSATEIGQKYEGAISKKSFYNRVLGWPWIDPDATPVSAANLTSCAAAGEALGVRWESKGDGRSLYVLGIDQMKGLNGHVIKKRLTSGHWAVVHIELWHHVDPFLRTHELMELYGIKAACVEIGPNANDAMKLAQAFPGRVFVVNSFNLGDGLVRWNDRYKSSTSENRTGDEFVNRFTASVNQYRCMDYSLHQFDTVNPRTVIPGNWRDLTIKRRGKNGLESCNAAEEFFYHLSKTALVTEYDDETTKTTHKVCKVGGFDPHLSFANHLCDVAAMRETAPTLLITPDPVTGQMLFDDVPLLRPGEVALPQVRDTAQVIQMARDEQAEHGAYTCGSCRHCQPHPNGHHFCQLDPTQFRVNRKDYRCLEGYSAK
ncbi:phage terminase large subunit GpA [Buttiauxella sp. BIGb0552]|uniref:phage terminase large subunit family protein n=1 Tax=Buttiauxella sp. BIGb0552 TaxID=2485120 RepID=UPI001064A90C|nr:phage terminase large subunit family protein [Buttiauxella sp. BIGb0552]TDX09589.1 phage terminase large subunit GpA [Buttiauxella sp. BIGb0552]